MPKSTAIIVPTNRSPSEIEALMDDLRKYSTSKNILATCMKLSAAKNRNIGLDWVEMWYKSDIVIQCDDDMEGFYHGWDQELIEPLLNKDDICFVCARPMTTKGKPAFLMRPAKDMVSPIVEVEFAPTACCAFRPRGLRFNEGFLGSGYEDDDMLMKLKKRNPGSRVVINNKCKLIHRNEMKNQLMYHDHNANLFFDIWGFVP